MPYKNKEDRKKYHKKYMKQYRAEGREKINKQRVKAWYEKYYETNKNKIIERHKQYFQKNKKFLNEYSKQWRKDNPDYYNHYFKNRRKTDLKFNLNEKIKTEIRKSLKGNKKGRHWESLVGYTLNDLIKRLNKTMPKGYTWQDYLKGELHIDHIIPKSVFNFTKPEHIDFKRCWALKNLRLLPIKENLSKSNKLIRPFQPALKI